MKFYDMISNFGEDMFKELPSKIRCSITNIKYSELKEIENEDFSIVLNSLWIKTIEVCKSEINSNYMNEVELYKDELIEDSKFHCILSIYISLINKNKECKSLEECMDYYEEYYDEFRSKGRRNISERYVLDKDFSKDRDQLRKGFIKNIDKYLNDIFTNTCNPAIYGSDFYDIFCDEFIRSYEPNNKTNRFIYSDPKLLYILVNKWDKCPYNNKYLWGMTFKKLYEFYDALEMLIESHDNIDDKKIYSYFIERLFNIHFLITLSIYIDEKFKAGSNYIIEEINIFKKIIEKRQSLKSKIVYMKDQNKKIRYTKDLNKEKLKKCMVSLIKEMKDYNYSKDIMIKIVEQLNEDIDRRYENLKIRAASILGTLSELGSLPMVFSREKYIDKIYKSFEKRTDNITFEKNLNINLGYFNNYLIPLMVKVFYYLIFLYISIVNGSEIHSYMKKELRKFIIENEDAYNYKKLNLSRSYEFSKELGDEKFQVNVVKKVYNNRFTREVFNKSSDFVKNVEDISFNYDREILDTSQYQVYYKNFPNNSIYLEYLNSKKRIK